MTRSVPQVVAPNAPVLTPSRGSGPQSAGGSALAHRTEGIQQTLTAGQAQVYPLTGRTAIDKHLLVTATDDRGTPAVNEINDPSNDSLGTQFIESTAYHYDVTSGNAGTPRRYFGRPRPRICSVTVSLAVLMSIVPCAVHT